MHLLPPKNIFMENAKAGKISPVYAELSFMLPQHIYGCLESPHRFLLESMNGPEKIARYSFIGAEPCGILRVKNGVIEIEGRRQRAEGRGIDYFHPSSFILH